MNGTVTNSVIFVYQIINVNSLFIKIEQPRELARTCKTLRQKVALPLSGVKRNPEGSWELLGGR